MLNLEFKTPDTSSPVPLYHQVEKDLRQLISSGELPVGAMMPTENQLCEAYGVSRQTMRTALTRLVDDGLITRTAGRGTFVLAQQSSHRFLLDRSFSQQMLATGRVPGSRVLFSRNSSISASSPPVFTHLVGAPCVELHRLRLGDGEPVGTQFSTILSELCPDLARHDFESAGLYDVLSTEYGLEVVTIDHAINATLADEGEAELLGVPPGAPLLVVLTTTYLASGELIEFTRSHYRTDVYEYTIRHDLG